MPRKEAPLGKYFFTAKFSTFFQKYFKLNFLKNYTTYEKIRTENIYTINESHYNEDMKYLCIYFGRQLPQKSWTTEISDCKNITLFEVSRRFSAEPNGKQTN